MKQIFQWQLPIYTVSEANSREHWAKKAVRHDTQRRWIWATFKTEKPNIPFPCHIKLTRVAKRYLDSDNLPVSMKYIRDAIADQIFPGLAPGQADNDSRLSWEYSQTKGKECSVIVTFYHDDTSNEL